MANRKSIASVLIFVGSMLCFFLPFVTVSCGGIKAFTLTGGQLAIGTTLTQPQPFGAPQTQKVAADPFAALAAVCGLAGIGLSLIGRKVAAGSAICGSLGTISLLIMRSRLDAQLQKQGEGMAQASYEAGYTLALLLLAAGAAWNIYLTIQSNKNASQSAVADGGISDSRNDSVASASPPLCGGCGKPVGASARFCESCGKPSEPAI
jgi:hypothetical protein